MTLLNITKTKQPETKTACESSECKQGEQLRYARPAYRVQKADASYQVAVDLPGVPKGGVEIVLEDGVLEIQGTRSWSDRSDWSPLAGAAEDGLTYRLRLSLGDEVSTEGITANLDDGVLKLTLAKAEEKKPRRIEVN